MPAPAKKQISINPDLFKVGGTSAITNKTRKNVKSLRPNKHTLVRPNKIKKELLKRIQNHQNNRELERNKNNSNKPKDTIDIGKFTDDFNDSLTYLETLSRDKNNNKNTTNDNNNDNNDTTINTNNNNTTPSDNNITVNTNLPMELEEKPIQHINPIVNGQPAYSNLKGGNKPGFREWKKETLKKSNDIDIKPAISVLDEHNFKGYNNERKSLLNKLKFKLKQERETNKEKHNISKLRKTMKKNSYYETFGGNKSKGFVGVLVKNKQTRKLIEQEKKLLKKHDIPKIRKYLQEHGLLKVGSVAPEDVLREIYEKTFLTGEIKNTSTDVLMHNYLND